MNNPFLLKGYISKEFFCGRDEEIKELFRNTKNGIDTTLISPRRMGKTGLIMRYFEYLHKNDPEIITIYIDIFASRSLNDFIILLAETILKAFPEKSTIGTKFMRFLKALKPLIGFDSITGEPQIRFIFHSEQDQIHTLNDLLQFLDSQKKQVVLAIDEFQQITEYPEKNMEAILRTYIQQLKKIRFIFCGSKKTIMTDIFSNAKRPFFASTSFLALDKIDERTYLSFITKSFTKYKYRIDEESLSFIINWTKLHTYYTQCLCNMIFSLEIKNITLDVVKQACLQLMKQQESIFLQYRQMLTPIQWNFLIALAKEEEVKQLTSQKFINNYNIGTPANSRRISHSLIEKELILAISEKTHTYYRVYDIILMRWLQYEY